MVRSVVGTKPTAVVADEFEILMAIVQLLNWFSHELHGRKCVIYQMQFMTAGCFHISR